MPKPTKSIDFHFKPKKTVSPSGTDPVNNTNFLNTPVNTTSTVDDANTVNNPVNNTDPNVNNLTNNSSATSSVNLSPAQASFKKSHPPENFKFPKTKFGTRERQSHPQWFKKYDWLHYDAKNDCVFCFVCSTHENKLSAEHNKEPAYISTGFRNWKKAPGCFKDCFKTRNVTRPPWFMNLLCLNVKMSKSSPVMPL